MEQIEPEDQFEDEIRAPKTARGRRFLKKKEPKLEEGPKKSLFIKG